MVTSSDRLDITMGAFKLAITVGKCRVSVDALVILKTISCQQLLYYDFVSVALCSTDDLPRKSEAHCYTKRNAKIMLYIHNVQIIVETAKLQISLRVLSVESQDSFLYYVRDGCRHSATLSFVC